MAGRTANSAPLSHTEYDDEQVKKMLAEASTIAEKLRVPFAASQVEVLPKPRSKEDNSKPKAGCRPNTGASLDGIYCGGFHVPSIHLSFVSHAALTNRLLEVDPEWTWEPMAIDEFGAPKLDQFGGLWIKLTVGGVTRPGYGDAYGKTASSLAVKEIIGDALRNAGMRFGLALQLWSKIDISNNIADKGYEEEAPKDPVVPSGRRAAKPAETPQEPDPGIDNPDFDDDTTGAMPKSSQRVWPPEGVDANNRFVLSAGEAKTSADLRTIWNAASREFGKELTRGQQAILDAIAGLGKDYADREGAAAAPAAQSTESAREAMQRGFQG